MSKPFVLVIFVVIVLSVQGSFTYDIPAASVSITGRTLPGQNGAVQFDWSQIEISTSFSGTGISALFDDTTENDYNAFIDGQLATIVNTTRGTTIYTIATNLKDGVHNVLLTKRTEAFFGIANFVGFRVLGYNENLDLVQDMKLSKKAPRRIEFIGDSITCGFGIMGKAPCPFTESTENEDLAYGPLTARHFNAELNVACWSGKGMVRNAGDKNITSVDPFPIYYPRTLANFPGVLWNFDNFRSDAVVINLGTNDYGSPPQPPQNVFIDGYNKFIEFVWSKYGSGVKLFLACGPMIGDPCCDYIKDIVAQHQGHGVYYVDMQGILSYPLDYGCDGHPSVSGHAKMANHTIPVIQKVMGW